MSTTQTRTEVPRRVVTGILDGKSVSVSDAAVPNAQVHLATRGLMSAMAWTTAPVPSLPLDHAEGAPAGISIPRRQVKPGY